MKEFSLRWSGITDRGRYRHNNEDAFLALVFDDHGVRFLGKEGESSTKEGDFIFAVSDGMGGANAGEFASRIAVQKITERLPRFFHRGSHLNESRFEEALSEVAIRTHADLIEMGNHYDECRGMGATLSLIWVMQGRLLFAHVGDSRIYHLPCEGGLRQISEDHSHVGRMLREGVISERQARMHPDRNVLDQALGGRQRELVPQIGGVSYQEGDRIVLCTDGITEGIFDRTIERFLREPPDRLAALAPANRLMREAFEESGRDNLTALVIEF